MNDLWTVEHVAAMLDMHPKTIRRHIRSGALKAAKVGGQWRVKKNDLEAFMDGRKDEHTREQTEDLKGFIEGRYTEFEGKLQVCTVVDFYVDSPAEAGPLSHALVDIMNSGDPAQGAAKYEYAYDAAERKARFVIWGNPRFVAKMLNAVADHT